MSISSLVLELWQFPFIRVWPEIWKSEIPPSEFFPISGDLGKLGIPNLARTSLIKCYWMLQNARVLNFTVSELLKKTGEVKLPSPLTPRNLYQLCTSFCLLSRILEIKEIYPNSKFIMLWLMMNFFLRNDWPTKGALPSSRDHCQILTIAILRHATSRTWTCAEPKFRLCWMKLCCSDKHYTKRPRLFPETGLVQVFFFSRTIPMTLTKYFSLSVTQAILINIKKIPSSLRQGNTQVKDFLKGRLITIQ